MFPKISLAWDSLTELAASGKKNGVILKSF